jgi:hypothetical protein
MNYIDLKNKKIKKNEHKIRQSGELICVSFYSVLTRMCLVRSCDDFCSDRNMNKQRAWSYFADRTFDKVPFIHHVQVRL